MNKAKPIFFASSFVLIFAYGFSTAHYRIFPYSVVMLVRGAAVDVLQYWKSYTHLAPSRWLAPSRKSGDGVTVWAHGYAQDGYTLISSMFDGDVAIRLIDLDGKAFHTWKIRYLDIWSKQEQKALGVQPLSNWDVGLMGVYMLEDGSVIFTFNNGGLVRLDKCGNVVWKHTYLTHHSIFASEDGTYWIPSMVKIYKIGEPTGLPLITSPFDEDSVIQVSESGKILREISVAKLLFKNRLESLLLANGVTSTTNLTDDYTHLNKVVVLQKQQAAAFPQFRQGDVMLSLRNLNLILVFDPETEKIKWFQTGPWLRQHDAIFTTDGHISMFDNHTDNADGRELGGSRILSIDPQSRDITTIYKGSTENPFYSAIEGNHVYLDNGDLLISESMAGRIFEVDKQGKIVWEYINRFDKEHVFAETLAYEHISRETVEQIDWKCTSSSGAKHD